VKKRNLAALGHALLVFAAIWLIALLCNVAYNWGWPDPWNWRPDSRCGIMYAALGFGVIAYVARSRP
jgi:hypothetical protein